MISQKTLKIAMGVSMVLCATASFAERGQDFESETLDSSNGWYGDVGSFENITPQAPTVGYPLPSSTHAKTLLVEGSVICSNTTSSAQSSISDFLIFIPEPSDELDGEDLGNAKIAIAAGTNWVDQAETKVKLCLYCKEGESAAAWHEIAEVTTSTWLRVTLVFKDNRCRVSLDGEPVHNNFGYKTSTDTTSTGGAWYNLAGSGTAVQSLSFIGCAKLDDVVIKDKYMEDAAFPDTAVATVKGESVSYNNLNKWNMTTNDVVTKWEIILNPESGMTVGDKLLCGLDPTTATKFEPLTVTPTGANTARITFPCEDASKTTRYSLVAQGGTAVFTGGATSITVSEGVATANITLTPETGSKVVKFWLKADNSNNGNN